MAVLVAGLVTSMASTASMALADGVRILPPHSGVQTFCETTAAYDARGRGGGRQRWAGMPFRTEYPSAGTGEPVVNLILSNVTYEVPLDGRTDLPDLKIPVRGLADVFAGIGVYSRSFAEGDIVDGVVPTTRLMQDATRLLKIGHAEIHREVAGLPLRDGRQIAAFHMIYHAVARARADDVPMTIRAEITDLYDVEAGVPLERQYRGEILSADEGRVLVLESLDLFCHITRR